LVNVTKRFGSITAIDHVNLEIRDGEYICILGPTGSGKTTLLRLIAGIIKPTEGEIYVDDKMVNDVPPQERNVAYVPQRYALFSHLRVIENVAFGPLSRGLRKEEAFEVSEQMLEMMRLAWRANSFPDELSGGMQQRLALARSLALGSKILLLDEPLGALDARLRVEIRYKLRELVKEKGLTAIHVTHNQEEAMTVADKLAVLKYGRIRQEDAPQKIYNEPQSIFIASFVGGANFLEGFISEEYKDGLSVQLRGRLRVRIKENGYAVGERVVLALREEMTRIVGEAGRNINILPGTIETINFLGNFVIYEVMLENGDRVNSKVPIPMDHQKFQKNEKVFLYLDPNYVKTFPYPSEGLYRELEVI